MSLSKSFLDDFRSKTVNFKVHLNCSDTLLSTCNLEVHIAVEIFKTLNVNHCHKVAVYAVVACDKTAADTCNGSLDRNACSHK